MRIRPDRKRLGKGLVVAAAVACVGTSYARGADQFFAGDGSALTASKWGTSAAGQFTSTFTSGNVANFATVNGTGTGATISVGGFAATENFTLTAIGGTIGNVSNSVVHINVSSGKTLDFGSEGFTTSASAGYIKDGLGAVALAGAAYGGGFTLNAGTIVARGVNAMGGNATPGALTINGGIVAASKTNDFSGKYSSITIGGDFQVGALSTDIAVASSTANMTFSNTVSLGNALRTITLGNNGSTAFGGVINNTSGGITFAANSSALTGHIDLTNTANLFTGPISITGGEVRFTAPGSYGATSNTITVDGGKLATVSGSSYTLDPNHSVSLGATAGTAISVTGSGTLTYAGALLDKVGSSGILVKQGAGALALGGLNTYTGSTSINNGTILLTTANDRLPTGTTLSLGQAGTATPGILDLNAFNQQIAGLNSAAGGTGTVSGSGQNTVTSASPAVLTFGGSGTYAFGDGTPANSGIITGAVSIAKTGTGRQTLGDTNTYTGSTSISGGTLVIASPGKLTSSRTSVTGGALAGTGSVAGISMSSGTLSPGNGTGTATDIGLLTATDSIAFTGGTFIARFNGAATAGAGSSYDQLLEVGTGKTVSLGTATNLAVSETVGPSLATGTAYPIILGAGDTVFSNAFANVSTDSANPTINAAGDAYYATYGTNEVDITFTTLAPEPSSLALIVIGATGLLTRRRRRNVIPS